MSRKTNRRQYAERIIKILDGKSALPAEAITETKDQKRAYALNRCLKNLIKSGIIKVLPSDNRNYLKLTEKGRERLNKIKLEGEGVLVPAEWDGRWRIVLLDMPEERKSEREALRYLLKKAGFACLKNTVWISPHPYENLFDNIKRDLKLTTELMIIVADKMDEETRKAFISVNLRG